MGVPTTVGTWCPDEKGVCMDSTEKKFISKHEQRSREGFSALQQFVIDQKACNYCGACVSVCPKDSIAMGDENPQLIGDCNACGVCYMACPRTFLPMTAMQQWLFNTIDIPPLGTYTHATLASSNSQAIMERSPDGGIVTTLFTYMLDNKHADAVITSGKQHNVVWCSHPRPKVVTDSGDLLECIDRKYDPNPLLSVLRDTTAFAKVAFAGLACHVLGLTKLKYAAWAYREELPVLAKIADRLTRNVDFVVGIGCMCRMRKGYWDVMLRENGVSNEGQVVKHYEERITGDYIFHLRDGGEVRIPHTRIIEDPHHMCFLCCDYDGYFSDLTVDRSEYQPYSTVLIRNETGARMFDQCREKNLLHTRDIPNKGEDFVEDMKPMLQALVDVDTYGYENFLKTGTFSIDPTMQQMMSHFEERRMRGIPENIFLEIIKKYSQFEFAKKKRRELGYENPDFY
jgi:coenzyme F420-reducing hydrogenase beta subunit